MADQLRRLRYAAAMDLDFDTLEQLRRNHPAWRLLLADHAPLVMAFLYRVYVKPNVRQIAQAELVSLLEDELFQLRQSKGAEAFPRTATYYLDDWAQDSRGWLRKYYPQGSDEAHFDLTPATEKTIAWLGSLTTRSFVGTESRLKMVFELLRQIVEGSVVDPATRIRELKRQKAEIDRQIQKIQAGQVTPMDETATRERFQHMAATARELLADFREVEQNFRGLDRSTRERIARWEGAKGELLKDILGQRDVINDSDQGKSFRAFWDFLMSAERQEELTILLDTTFGLPAIQELKPDGRLRRVHYDWLEAGEHTQRTVALLSRQLRRFLDDQVWLENRRIMEIIHNLETNALELRDQPPEGPFMDLDQAAPDIELPMERPLFTPPLRPNISQQGTELADEPIASDALFNQWMVDKAALQACLRQVLAGRDQIRLSELVAAFPLEQGLAELLTWLSLAAADPDAIITEDTLDTIAWTDPAGIRRRAELPRVVFTKEPVSHAR